MREEYVEDMFPVECRRRIVDEAQEVVRVPKLKEVNRKQLIIRPCDIEKLIEADHAARGIWELVSSLDLSGYYKEIASEQGEAGRPAIDPKVLVSLWLYAYSEGVGSAREISELCRYHPAYQWLTGMEEINHHTLSDFRVKNKVALDELMINCLGVLSHHRLIQLEGAATHDGSKIRANAKGSSFHRENTLQDHLETARQLLEEMGDPCQEGESRKAAAARRAAQGKCQRVHAALQTLEEMKRKKTKADARVSETDPDARVMKQPNGGFNPSYNVQITADTQHAIIIGVGVSQSGNDRGQLPAALHRVHNNLGKPPGKLLVDSDFVTRETVLEMSQGPTELISPVVDRQGISQEQFERRGIAPEFRSECFTYQKNNDTYICPAGKILTFYSKEKDPGITRFFYRANLQDCQNCRLKQQCCPKTQYRSICRNQQDKLIDDFEAKMQTPKAKEIYKKRTEVAEFIFAWLKEKMRLRQFRLRGLVKVTMEITWAAIAYNIRQWLRLVWRPLKLVQP